MTFMSFLKLLSIFYKITCWKCELWLAKSRVSIIVWKINLERWCHYMLSHTPSWTVWRIYNLIWKAISTFYFTTGQNICKHLTNSELDDSKTKLRPNSSISSLVQTEQWTTELYVWRLPKFYDKYSFRYTYRSTFEILLTYFDSHAF